MKSALRLIRIIYVFSKYRLDVFIPKEYLPFGMRLLLALGPWRLNPISNKYNRGERIRLALIALGPIFIKFGQILSTRRDLLPPDVADELAKLQDQVPPFSSDIAKDIIEVALADKIENLFSSFDSEPLASASIAQVHSAILANGDEVIVKVIRPNIERVIQRDTQLMHQAAQLVEQYSSEGKRLRPVEVVADYRHTILNELDLLSEAANGSQLRRNFKNSPLLYVPDVYWELCRTNVMVQERIYGVPVSEVEQLKAAGTDMKVLADRGVEIFFTQVFRDSFFHADMHPGNIFVDITDPALPKYIGIDCGIVGTLTREDQNYLAKNLLAFFNQDYYQVAKLHIDSGWVASDTKVNEFEAAIRAVAEPIFEKPLAEISFGQVLIQLFQTARKFNMEVQPQLVLLQKTLLNIEGLGRQLYPQLDLWQTAKPYLEGWFKDQYGPNAIWTELTRQVPIWLERAPHMPQLIHDALVQVQNIDQTLDRHQQAMVRIDKEISSRQKSRAASFIGMALVGSGLLYGMGLLPEMNPISWAAIGVGLSMVWLKS